MIAFSMPGSALMRFKSSVAVIFLKATSYTTSKFLSIMVEDRSLIFLHERFKSCSTSFGSVFFILIISKYDEVRPIFIESRKKHNPTNATPTKASLKADMPQITPAVIDQNRKARSLGSLIGVRNRTID